MRLRAVRFAAPLLFLAGAAAPVLAEDPAPEAPKVELRIDVKAGDVFYFRQTQSTDQAIQMGSLDMTNATAMTQTMTYAVTALHEDGTFDVKVSIGDIKGTFENPMLGNLEFDTASGEDPAADNPMLGPALKGMTMLANRSYEMTMDRRGTVKSIRGLREIIEDALKGNPMLGSKALGGMLDDDALKSQAQGQFALLPEAPVAVGATWEGRTSGKGAMGIETVTEFTLKSADAANAVVGWKSKAKAMAPDAAKAGTADVAGSVTLSRKDGMIVRSESSTHSVNDMDMPGGAAPGSGDGEAPKMHIDATVKMTLERISAADAKPAPKKEAPKAPEAPAVPK